MRQKRVGHIAHTLDIKPQRGHLPRRRDDCSAEAVDVRNAACHAVRPLRPARAIIRYGNRCDADAGQCLAGQVSPGGILEAALVDGPRDTWPFAGKKGIRGVPHRATSKGRAARQLSVRSASSSTPVASRSVSSPFISPGPPDRSGPGAGAAGRAAVRQNGLPPAGLPPARHQSIPASPSIVGAAKKSGGVSPAAKAVFT